MVTRSKSQPKSRVKPSAKPKPQVKSKPQAAKKPAAKRASANAAASKRAANTPDRDTLAKLRAYVDDIEKRLKRANSLTRTSVRALKTSYEALDGDNHTTALTGHIEELSERLTGMIEQTRQDVAHDLKIVLGDPRLETLSGALTNANQRLTLAEQNQAEAINAINTHIARLATAVDERMQREQIQREKGHAVLSVRMDTIEQETATAITSIGDKVVNVSESLAQETQVFRGEMAEKAVLQQQDYEEHKHQIAQRIETIEDEQRNQLPAFERDIETLNTRLEALESNVGMYGQPVEPVISEPAYEAAPQISTLMHDAENQYENTKADDAFAALELVEMQEVSPPASAPELTKAAQPQYQTEIVPELVQQPIALETQAYAPVEYSAQTAANMGAVATAGGQNAEIFSPRAYVPGGQTEAMPDVPPPYAVVDNGAQGYTPQEATNIAPPPTYAEQPAYDPAVYDQTMPPPPMPVTAVPDIQTLEPTMESVRPGAEPSNTGAKSSKIAAKIFNMGGGDGGHGLIRKIALFGGVAVVALFAYKTFAPKISGGGDPATQSTQSEPKKSLASIQVSGNSAAGSIEIPGEFTTSDGQNFESVEPVGDYSKTMAAPDLGGTNNKGQQRTLEAAASAGNAIAQFQLGLSHLEAGRDADAVRLIRLSANQGQPAAQYRLAKLYEAGIGVKVNGKTAKDLLTRSANAGNRIAMHDLGHYYATGADGAAPNLQQAVKWFSMAAERGVLDSQFNLAVLHQGGTGVPRSLENAYIWYAIAGAQGDKIAAQRSEAVARELSEDGLAKAKARVKAYAPKPADNAANGVFKNLPWIAGKQVTGTPRQNSSLKNVKGAQKMLASLGYAVGKPDGNLGPNTRNAIMKFERANGLPETGRVNAALIERLQLAAGV